MAKKVERAGRCDLLIIGSGAAGLSVALAAHDVRPELQIVVLSPGRLAFDGSSVMAQGGIAAAMGDGDDAAQHANDTFTAGGGRGDVAVIEQLTAAAADTVAWLQKQGCEFDRSADGRIRLGREAAHGRARIVHAGGDRSGNHIMQALLQAVRRRPGIRCRENWRAVAPLMDGNAVAGARLLSGSGERCDLQAGATVLASGGLASLFRHHTTAAACDGSGHCFALAAGAELIDLEFVQFHPTALWVGSNEGQALPLISEALRGAGARLRDSSGCYLFPDGGDLGPRDQVARAVFRASQAGQVTLDLRGPIASSLQQEFPGAAALCRAHGIDPTRTGIPVTAAAHYHMGGVRVGPDAGTGVPGLYAVGEVACTGAHGANRLASNSLLEALAFGRELGARLAAGLDRNRTTPIRYDALSEVAGTLPRSLQADIADCLWQAAGPVREAAALEQGMARMGQFLEQYKADPAAVARLSLAGMLLRAAWDRAESVGSHYRCDGARSNGVSAARAA